MQGLDQTTRPSLDRPRCAIRGMHQQHAARVDAEGGELCDHLGAADLVFQHVTAAESDRRCGERVRVHGSGSWIRSKSLPG